MLQFTYKDTPDVDTFAEDIGASGTKVYVHIGTMKILACKYAALEQSAYDELEMLIQSISGGQYRRVAPLSIINVLREFCGCTNQKFSTDTGKPSLDMKTVVEPLIDTLEHYASNPNCLGGQHEDALLLLYTYKSYKAIKTRRALINAKLNRVVDESLPGWTGRLNSVAFKYKPCETGRFYTYDDSIQNWPLELCEAITVPRDYFLVWADFDQIDFRVGYHIYLRERGSADDAIYLAATDKYRGMYEIICRAADKEPNFDLFTKFRKSYKKAILSAMYNASEQSLFNDIKNHELAHELYQYFATNKKYQSFRRSIDRLLNYHVDAIVTDYFGFTRSIPLPNLSNNRDVNDAISRCCNTPIQSTSNSILILWLEATLRMFEAQGFSRKEHVIPYLIRHDECIFMVHKSVMPKMYLFKQAMTVQIDDWDKITLEPHFGWFYKQPVEQLEALYQSQCIEHDAELQAQAASMTIEPRPVYRPIQEVLDVYCYDMMPIKKRAQANYEQSGITLTCGVSDNPEDWSEADSCAVLADIIAQRPECTMLQRILEHHNQYLVYSRKLNKYTLSSSLDYVVACTEKLGTNKVMIYNTGIETSMLHKGVMFRVVTTNAHATERLFDKIKELGYPEGWVSLS